MLTLEFTRAFSKDLRRSIKRARDFALLFMVVAHLLNQEPLPAQYRDHELGGEFQGCRECHVQPDWLLVYRVRDDALVLVRTGSHADLFERSRKRH